MIKVKSLIFGLTALLGFNAFAGNVAPHAVHAVPAPLDLSVKEYVPDKFDFIDYYGTVGDVDAAQGGGITSFAHMAGLVPLKGDAIKVTSTLKLLSSRDVVDGGDGVDGWITYSFSAVPGGAADNSFPYFGGSGSGYVFMFKNVSGTTAPNTAQLIFVQFENGVDTLLGTPFVDNMMTNTGVLANDPIAFDLELFKEGGAYTASIKNHETGASLFNFPGLPLNESLFINELGQTFLSSAIYEANNCDGNHWDHRGIMVHSFDAFTYDASTAVVTLTPEEAVFDGLSHKPTVAVNVGLHVLVEDTDYYVESSAITNVGSTTVRVNFINDFAGNAPIEKEFKVNARDASAAVVTLEEDEFVHTGSAIEPVVSSVKLGETTLVVETDYTVSFLSNTAVGTGKVVITFKGNYAGSVQKDFSIIEAPVDPGTSETPVSETPVSEPATSQATSSPAETPKTGCFGNVAATVSMALAIAGLATVLIIKKKRLG